MYLGRTTEALGAARARVAELEAACERYRSDIAQLNKNREALVEKVIAQKRNIDILCDVGIAHEKRVAELEAERATTAKAVGYFVDLELERDRFQADVERLRGVLREAVDVIEGIGTVATGESTFQRRATAVRARLAAALGPERAGEPSK